MMTRRTLLKLAALLPLVGPTIAKALTKSAYKAPLVSGPYLPPDFPKWSKAIDGLEDAGKWAMEFERAQLPPGAVFPRIGQIWEAVRDCQVGFPFIPFRKNKTPLLGGTVSLVEGARVRVIDLDGLKPMNVTFQPLRWEEVQLSEHFDGFESSNLRLMLRTVRTRCCMDKEAVFFTETFRLVEDVACMKVG
jgi:hypothetical protein